MVFAYTNGVAEKRWNVEGIQFENLGEIRGEWGGGGKGARYIKKKERNRVVDKLILGYSAGRGGRGNAKVLGILVMFSK